MCRCPDGKVWNDDEEVCECPDGKVWNDDEEVCEEAPPREDATAINVLHSVENILGSVEHIVDNVSGKQCSKKDALACKDKLSRIIFGINPRLDPKGVITRKAFGKFCARDKRCQQCDTCKDAPPRPRRSR